MSLISKKTALRKEKEFLSVNSQIGGGQDDRSRYHLLL
jgi:hypothetical protein